MSETTEQWTIEDIKLWLRSAGRADRELSLTLANWIFLDVQWELVNQLDNMRLARRALALKHFLSWVYLDE